MPANKFFRFKLNFAVFKKNIKIINHSISQLNDYPRYCLKKLFLTEIHIHFCIVKKRIKKTDNL